MGWISELLNKLRQPKLENLAVVDFTVWVEPENMVHLGYLVVKDTDRLPAAGDMRDIPMSSVYDRSIYPEYPVTIRVSTVRRNYKPTDREILWLALKGPREWDWHLAGAHYFNFNPIHPYGSHGISFDAKPLISR